MRRWEVRELSFIFFLAFCFFCFFLESGGAELILINPPSSVKDTGYKTSPHFRPVSCSAALTSERLSRGGRKVNIRSVWTEVCED